MINKSYQSMAQEETRARRHPKGDGAPPFFCDKAAYANWLR